MQGIRTIFKANDLKAAQEALDLAGKQRDERQFTNMNQLVLLCKDCGEVLVGQEQAQKHAMTTRHVNFEEVQ